MMKYLAIVATLSGCYSAEEAPESVEQSLTGCQTYPTPAHWKHQGSGTPIVTTSGQCTYSYYHPHEPHEWLIVPPTFLGMQTNPPPPSTYYGPCMWLGPLQKINACTARQRFTCPNAILGTSWVNYTANYYATKTDWSKVTLWMQTEGATPPCTRTIAFNFHSVP